MDLVIDIMKLYKNITRFAYRDALPKSFSIYKMLHWGAGLKVSDVVATCMGFNSRIAAITPEIKRVNNGRNGWFVNDIKLTDDEGHLHWVASGGGCVLPKETVEQINKYWQFTDEEFQDWEEMGYNTPFTHAIRAALKQGKPFVDSDGVLLPEFTTIRAFSRS